MKRKLSILLLLALLMAGCSGDKPQISVPPTTTNAPSTQASQATEAPAATEVPPTTQAPPETEPQEQTFYLSFAGDCTLGGQVGRAIGSASYIGVVGDRYDYPFSNVYSYFASDDWTFVNLEGPLTDAEPTEAEQAELSSHQFLFRGRADYAKILSAGSVEFACCTNNHSKDCGAQGLLDTYAALEAEGVAYTEFQGSGLFTTASGLRIGVISSYYCRPQASQVQKTVEELRSQGAELIVLTAHWGEEGTYHPTASQRSYAHQVIDAGVDILWGTHSHTLQEVEEYGGGIIYYSLGNFSYGGNTYPLDYDTAVLCQEVVRQADGSVKLGSWRMVPCSVSSTTGINNYCPTPYAVDDPGFDRVTAKLTGNWEGNDLDLSYRDKL